MTNSAKVTVMLIVLASINMSNCLKPLFNASRLMTVMLPRIMSSSMELLMQGKGHNEHC